MEDAARPETPSFVEENDEESSITEESDLAQPSQEAELDSDPDEEGIN